jgi:hypothetical protein
MRTKHIPFLQWTKNEIFCFCISNGYGEPKFSGKKKTMYIKKHLTNWGNRIINELAGKVGYSVEYI